MTLVLVHRRTPAPVKKAKDIRVQTTGPSERLKQRLRPSLPYPSTGTIRYEVQLHDVAMIAELVVRISSHAGNACLGAITCHLRTVMLQCCSRLACALMSDVELILEHEM